MNKQSKPVVLLMEDDMVLRRYLAKLLRADGFDCLEAASVQEALSFVRSRTVNLAVADLQLSDNNALVFVKQLVAIKQRLPVIIVTAFGEWETYLEALDWGVVDYMSKPLEYKELREKIEIALSAAPPAGGNA